MGAELGFVAHLIAITALGPLALNILLPSLPRLPEALDTDFGTAQLTLSLFLAGLAVCQLVYGPLSDRFGRRPVLLAGLGLFIAGSALGLVADHILTVIAARLIQAIGGCAGLVLARAIVRDLYPRDRAASVLGYVTMAMVVAPMLAPVIGGYLDVWFGWRAGFAVVGLAGLAVLAATLAGLRETHFDRQSLPGPTGLVLTYAGLLARPGFARYAGHTAFATAGFFAFLGGAPFVVVELMGRSPSAYGIFFALSALGYMAGNFAAGRLSTAIGIDRMLLAGATISMLGALVMLGLVWAGWLTPLTLFGPMLVFGFGNGLSIPNGIAGAVSADPRRAGAASGLTGFLQMGTGAAVSALVGHIVVDSAVPMAAVMSGAALLALLVVLPTSLPGRAAEPVPPDR